MKLPNKKQPLVASLIEKNPIKSIKKLMKNPKIRWVLCMH